MSADYPLITTTEQISTPETRLLINQNGVQAFTVDLAEPNVEQHIRQRFFNKADDMVRETLMIFSGGQLEQPICIEEDDDFASFKETLASLLKR